MSLPDVRFADRAVYLPAADTLVLADLHLGRVRASRVEMPLGEHADLRDRIQGLLRTHDPAQVLLAGDLLHDFDSIPSEVAETIGALTDAVADAGADLTVVAGNHDTQLVNLESVDPVPFHRVDSETVVLHGHEEPPVAAARYLIGHEHPAITIEGQRRPCFLACPDQLGGAGVLVLPAFSRTAVGTTVNGRSAADTMSPLLTALDRCRPIVSTDEEPLEFPPLGDLRDYL